MTIKPPKCKTCSAEEWRHVCGGASAIRVKAIIAELADKLFLQPQSIPGGPSLLNAKRGRPKTQTSEQRKEYLKRKAAERRAKGKAKA